MYRRVHWDEFFLYLSLSSMEPLMTIHILHNFYEGKRHVENILFNYCACMVTILLHCTTQKLESVAQLMYIFVTIPAINSRSDSRILKGGGFVPYITGIETRIITDRAIEVHSILLAG